MTKACTACETDKNASEFYANPTGRDGLQSHCKPCMALDHRRYRYGVDPPAWVAMIEAQDGRCACCAQPFASSSDMHLDHDHKCCRGRKTCGRCVRKILCAACNKGLGSFLDSPDRLRAAIRYLERFS